MKIPGTFDGTRYKDLRLVHLSLPIIMWYAKHRLFDDIVKVNSGELTRSVWLKNGIKHSWRSGGYKNPYIVTEFDSRGYKLRSCPVILPTVPEYLTFRYAQPTPEEIYALVTKLSRIDKQSVPAQTGHPFHEDGWDDQ